MGQSKNGGYQKIPTVSGKTGKALDKFLKQSQGLLNESADIYRGFGPGGQAGQAVTDEANRNFQQQTVPSILNSYGSGNKGSSSLNQALAAGASNLNSNIAAQLAQNQFGAAQGLGGLGSGQAQLGSQSQFAYAPQQQPFWQSLLLGGVNAGGQVGQGYFAGKGI